MSARIVAVAFAAVSVTVNLASAQDAERWQDKRARAETFNAQQVQGDNLLPPGHSTSTRSYLGVEIHQGGLYEPSIFPTETWLEIACIHDDLQVQYSITEHGSSLFKIHALVYDADIEKIHDTDGHHRFRRSDLQRLIHDRHQLHRAAPCGWAAGGGSSPDRSSARWTIR